MSVKSPTDKQRLAACQRPLGFPVMRQRWAGLLFLHWPLDPAEIARRLPPGLHVDTFGGEAWLGVVPFFMERVRPLGLPPVPGLSWFLELNLRTYVYDEHGNPGVWFFSLDCNQALAVEIARRAFHLPYQHATIDCVKSGPRLQYTSRRKSHAAVEARFDYEIPSITQPAVPGSLEWFLVERYLLFAANPAGKIYCGRVHHSPYQIAPAVCTRWSTEAFRLNHFSPPDSAPPSMLTAAAVEVSIFPLRACPV